MIPAGEADGFRYWAFISYSHRDSEWGAWLHGALETYRVPHRLRGRPGRDGPVPARAYPVFRDQEELPGASDLGANIRAALAQSRCLIVICSPHAARSIWVDREVREFKAMGRDDRILALIVDGEPNATDRPDSGLPECFPDALRYRVDPEGRLTAERTEPIAADARDGRKSRARSHLKLVAGVLGVGFDELYQRDRQRWWWRVAQAAVAGVALLGTGAVAWQAQRAESWKAQARQSELLAEQARRETLAGSPILGIQLALEALPRSLERPERPVVATATRSLFAALAVARWSRLLSESAAHGAPVRHVQYSPDGRRFVTAGDDFVARVWADSGTELAALRGHEGPVRVAAFNHIGDRIVTASDDGTARIWDAHRGTVVATLRGHRGRVTRTAFSADGQRVLTAADDGTARVWTADGNLVAVLAGHAAPLNDAVFAPAGDRVATASEDHTVIVWHSETGQPATRIRGARRDGTGQEHSAPAVGTAFSPSGRLLLIATHDDTARLWDLASGRLRAELPHGDNHYGRNRVVALFSADGQRILTASGDGRARVWDVDGRPRATLEIGQSGLRLSADPPRALHAAMSPDGTRAVVGYEDRTARLWDLERGSLVAVLRGHRDAVWVTVFSSDGRRVLTASPDGTARQWDMASAGVTIFRGPNAPFAEWYGAPSGALPFPGGTGPGPAPGALIPGTPSPVAPGGPIPSDPTGPGSPGLGRLIGPFAPGPRLPSIIRTGLSFGAFSPDGTRVVTVSGDGLGRLWETATGSEIAVLRGHGAAIQHATYSADGTRVVTSSQDTTARLWDGRSGAPLAVLRGHDDGMIGWIPRPGSRPLDWGLAWAAFAPGGDQVVTASHDGTARLWDARDGGLRAVLRGHRGSVHWAGFSPDGRRVATASGDGTIRTWEAGTGRPLLVMNGHAGGAQHATFDRAGGRILSGGGDGTARIWDGNDGRELALLRGHAGAVTRVEFAGERALTGSVDYTARLWDARTGVTQAILRGHQGPVTAVAVSPDGQLLATASADGTARLWDGETGDPLVAAGDHDGPVVHLEFDAAANQLLTIGGTGDGTARVWWLPPRGTPLLEMARRRAPHRGLPEAATVPRE